MTDCFTAILVVAQASGRRTVMTPEEFREVLFWLGVIVALGIVAGLIGFWVYRRYKEQNAAPPADATYSLGEMRRLYEDGEISHDEYIAVRTRLLAAAKAMTAQYAASQHQVVVTPSPGSPGSPIADASIPPTAPPLPRVEPPSTPPPKNASQDDEEPII